MLELVLVLFVISILISFSYGFYIKNISESKLKSVEFQSSFFRRMVQNIHAYGESTGFNVVVINGKKIYLNQYGFPANAQQGRSTDVNDQSAEECQQLWDAFFQAKSERQYKDKYKKKKSRTPSVIVTVNKNQYCRYDLFPSQAGAYFFDYHFKTGTVLLGTSG